MTTPRDRYAVIGHPVAHSRSPAIHTLFAQQCQQNMTYELLPAEPDAFTATASRFFADGGAGLNVTLPFKEQAFQLADRLTRRARQAGAVNTLKAEQGQLLGDNTDGIGLVTDLEQRLGLALAGKRLLILGAGGAVRGVVPALLAAGASHITIANRTLARAEHIAAECADLGLVQACRLQEAPTQADLVINAISSGLTESRTPDLHPAILQRAQACYDMLYARHTTPFLAWAQDQGITTSCDGFGMLVEQAAESFALWRGIRPDTAPIFVRLQPQYECP